jgi:hypothetical protein
LLDELHVGQPISKRPFIPSAVRSPERGTPCFLAYGFLVPGAITGAREGGQQAKPTSEALRASGVKPSSITWRFAAVLMQGGTRRTRPRQPASRSTLPCSLDGELHPAYGYRLLAAEPMHEPF